MPEGNIYDHRDIIYSANMIYSDGERYDLTKKSSINSIKMPVCDYFSTSPIAGNLGVTGTLDYVLRMKAGQYWNECNFGMAICVLEKATVLMQSSSIGWPKRDFYRIVNWLIDLGCLRRAEQWRQWVNASIPDDTTTIPPTQFIPFDYKTIFELAAATHTDLVKMFDIRSCCEQCAKYRNRIYSISGRDRRFPRLPSDLHGNCGLCATTYYEDMEPLDRKSIRHNKRRFVDDRTDEEKANYKKRIEQLEQMQRDLVRKPDPARTSYFIIKKYLPDAAPKSMSGYLRMYRANSKNYQKLLAAVAEANITLPATVNDLLKLEHDGSLLL